MKKTGPTLSNVFTGCHTCGWKPEADHSRPADVSREAVRHAQQNRTHLVWRDATFTTRYGPW